MTDGLTDAQLSRIPKWAQDHIAVLESRVRALTDRLGEGPAESRVCADPYAEAPRPLGDSLIRFQMTADSREWVDVKLNRDGGYLDIHATYDLVISPRASNGAHLRTVHHTALTQLDHAALERAAKEAAADG